MSHTPTPWKAYRDKQGQWRVRGTEGPYLFISSGANAEFIVRACNSHTDLLAALEGMLAERESHRRPLENGAAVMVCQGCFETARDAEDAIAKAKE